jgi:hypothetical protein
LLVDTKLTQKPRRTGIFLSVSKKNRSLFLKYRILQFSLQLHLSPAALDASARSSLRGDLFRYYKSSGRSYWPFVVVRILALNPPPPLQAFLEVSERELQVVDLIPLSIRTKGFHVLFKAMEFSTDSVAALSLPWVEPLAHLVNLWKI